MASSTPDPGAVRSQLARILESEGFANSPLLGRFLSFTVEQTLDGNIEILKESTLGTEVCGRPNFDPRYDSVVRTTATRLRNRLAEHYAIHPPDIWIEYPRGSYVPVFRTAPEPEEVIPSEPPVPVTVPQPPPPKIRITPVFAGAAICGALVVGLGFGVWLARPKRPPQEPTRRFSLGIPPDAISLPLVASGPARVSPDGRIAAAAYQASSDPADQRIFLYDLEQGTWRALFEKKVRGIQPVWSPDGSELLFSSYSRIIRTRADGTHPQVVTENPGGFNSASWSERGKILFSSVPLAGLSVVAATGGKPVQITTPVRPKELWHYSPVFLPGGDEFLFTIVGTERSEHSVFVASLANPADRKRLLTGASGTTYFPTGPDRGMLVYQGSTSLMAVRYRQSRRELEGEPFSIGSSVAMDASRALADFSVSTDGTLVSRTGTGVQLRRLRIVDSAGQPLDHSPEDRLFRFPTLSPDGSKIATGIIDSQTGLETVWILDREWKNPRRLVPGTLQEHGPKWSPDGKRIAFCRNGEIHVADASGNGLTEQITKSGGTKNVTGWTPNGEEIIYYQDLGADRRNDILAVVPKAGAEPRAIVSTPANEFDATVSPDGRHIVFLADESGKTEVYLQNYPMPGEKTERRLIQVSAGGGFAPHFAAKGQEIRYVLSNSRQMASVPVRDGAIARAPRIQMETPGWFHRGYGLDCAGPLCVISAPGAEPQLSPPMLVLHPKWLGQR